VKNIFSEVAVHTKNATLEGAVMVHKRLRASMNLKMYSIVNCIQTNHLERERERERERIRPDAMIVKMRKVVRSTLTREAILLFSVWLS
jgi:hypothetical protein